MQKQPKYPYSYSEVRLDSEYPFCVSSRFEQKDKAITRLHFHQYPELGVCLEGTGVFAVEGKTLPFKAGDIVFIERTERHLARSAPGAVSEWHWIYFDLAKLLPLGFIDASLADLSPFRGLDFKNVISPSDCPRLCSLARELMEEGLKSLPGKRERLLGLLLLFSTEMRRAFPEFLSAPKEGRAAVAPEPDAMQRLSKALELVANEHGKAVGMAKLAALCGLSQTHFRRLFRKTLGKSPRQYLNQMRIAMAMAELSRSKRPIAEIAMSCGFETLSSFNRQFKAQTGKAPREWRASSGV